MALKKATWIRGNKSPSVPQTTLLSRTELTLDRHRANCSNGCSTPPLTLALISVPLWCQWHVSEGFVMWVDWNERRDRGKNSWVTIEECGFQSCTTFLPSPGSHWGAFYIPTESEVELSWGFPRPHVLYHLRNSSLYPLFPSASTVCTWNRWVSSWTWF